MAQPTSPGGCQDFKNGKTSLTFKAEIRQEMTNRRETPPTLLHILNNKNKSFSCQFVCLEHGGQARGLHAAALHWRTWLAAIWIALEVSTGFKMTSDFQKWQGWGGTGQGEPFCPTFERRHRSNDRRGRQKSKEMAWGPLSLVNRPDTRAHRRVITLGLCWWSSFGRKTPWWLEWTSLHHNVINSLLTASLVASGSSRDPGELTNWRFLTSHRAQTRSEIKRTQRRSHAELD